MNRTALALGLAAALWLGPSTALAFSDGTAEGATDCAPCHASTADPELTVTITGPAELALGEVATYTVSIPMVGAGGALDIVADGDALLSPLDANTQLDSGELVHVDSFSSPPGGNLGDWSYDFELMAPEFETVTTLTALMMAFNGDGDNDSGDIWNVGALAITVPEPGAGTAAASALMALVGLAMRRRA